MDHVQFLYWLVVCLPLWKMMEFASWDYSLYIYMGKSWNFMFPNHQPDDIHKILLLYKSSHPWPQTGPLDPSYKSAGHPTSIKITKYYLYLDPRNATPEISRRKGGLHWTPVTRRGFRYRYPNFWSLPCHSLDRTTRDSVELSKVFPIVSPSQFVIPMV